MRDRNRSTFQHRAAVAVGITLFLTGCSNGLAGCQSRDTTASGEASQQTASPSLGSSPTHGSEIPDNNPDGGSNGSGTNPDGGSNPVQYTWTLPPSDTSVSGNDGPAYGALRRSCQDGQNYLNEVAPYYGFRSPRNVVLFVAGLRICNGDLTGAQVYYDHAQNFYGLEGLAPEGIAECDLYKSVRSVLEQRPREEFVCLGGSPPGYKYGDTGLMDDPVTLDVDESIPQTPDPAITSDNSSAPAVSVSEPAE